MPFVAFNAVSLAFVAAAAIIGASGHDGWGWCIFGAIVCHVAPASKED